MSTLKGDLALMYVFALMSHKMIYSYSWIKRPVCFHCEQLDSVSRL